MAFDEGLAPRRQLETWIDRALDFVRSLPPK